MPKLLNKKKRNEEEDNSNANNAQPSPPAKQANLDDSPPAKKPKLSTNKENSPPRDTLEEESNQVSDDEGTYIKLEVPDLDMEWEFRNYKFRMEQRELDLMLPPLSY
jgi:hypothetical protein